MLIIEEEVEGVAEDVNMEKGELGIIQEGKEYDSALFEIPELCLEDKGETEEGAKDVDMEKGEHDFVQEGEKHDPALFEIAEMDLEDKGETENAPISTPPPEGSSRATGGVLRGRAMGNVLNFPDAPDL
jgi:hypothetical protein